MGFIKPHKEVEWDEGLFILCQYLVEQGYNAEELLDVIEKPYKWDEELKKALKEHGCHLEWVKQK